MPNCQQGAGVSAALHRRREAGTDYCPAKSHLELLSSSRAATHSKLLVRYPDGGRIIR